MNREYYVASGCIDLFFQLDWVGFLDIPVLVINRPPEAGYCGETTLQTAYSEDRPTILKGCEKEFFNE